MNRILVRALRVAALTLATSSALTGLARAASTCGADPAVVKLDYKNIVPTIAGELATYTFQFVATVQNVGNKDYTSTAGAQSFTITGDDKVLATMDFPSLAAGASRQLTAAVTNWSPMDGTQQFTAALKFNNPAADCVAGNDSLGISAEDLEPKLRGQ